MTGLFNTMIILFVIILIGYLAGKLNIIDKTANKIFSNLMLNITAPFLVISSVATSKPDDIPVNIFHVMIIGFILYILLILFGRLYIKLTPLNEFEKPVHEVAMIFGNVAFLGYPVFEALLGKSAIFVSTILNLPFNMLIFSYGMYLFTKDTDKNKINIKTLINPAFLSSIIALIIYLTGIKIPFVISEIFSSIGGITIPLSMLLIGSSLAEINLKYLFKDYKVMIYSLIKLVILPVITFFILRIFTDNQYLIKMITLNVAFPAASLIVMFATQFNKSIRSASIIVFMSTLFSIITLPLIEKYLFILL